MTNLKLKSEDLKDTWIFYKKHNSTDARDQLIAHYYPLVCKYANQAHKKINSNEWEVADLITFGYQGLVDAMERYDLNHKSHAQFLTYAHVKIKGRIIDEVRSKSKWKRCDILRLKKYNEIHEKLTHKYQRKVSQTEVYQYLDRYCSTSIDWIRHYRLTSVASLDHTVADIDDSDNRQDFNSALLTEDKSFSVFEKKDEWRHFFKEIKDIITERELKILIYYHCEGLSYRQVSIRIGLCACRCRQLNVGAIAKLRQAHEDEIVDLKFLLGELKKC